MAHRPRAARAGHREAARTIGARWHRPCRRPASCGGRAAHAVRRAPRGATRVLLPWLVGGRGRRGPGHTTGHREITYALRPARASARRGRDGRCRMTSAMDPFRYSDAAYVLGALDDADRRDFEAHLETCPDCQ